jgi:hypothetical protein
MGADMLQPSCHATIHCLIILPNALALKTASILFACI